MDVTPDRTGTDAGGLAVDDDLDAGGRARVGRVEGAPDPVQPGFWMTVLGSFAAILAPLIGFLGGSASGAGYDQTGRRLAVWLMVGLVVGGLGVLCAFVGAVRWWRGAHR